MCGHIHIAFYSLGEEGDAFACLAWFTVHPTRSLASGVIFPDRAGKLRMKVHRLKHGQNPFVTLHPAVENFLSAWRTWLATAIPDEVRLFPLGTDDQTILNRALNSASSALGLPHFKPHGFGRAFYVKVRRSQGTDDSSIAGELGQTTNGDLIRSVYGDPDDLHGGALFDWLPEDHAPAWNLLAVKPDPFKAPRQDNQQAVVVTNLDAAVNPA